MVPAGANNSSAITAASTTAASPALVSRLFMAFSIVGSGSISVGGLPMRMAGKIGIVTAAASGMGRAGALRFAREGAQVAVVDVDAEGVRRVVAEITAAGGVAHGIAADLTKDADSRRIVWDTVERFKGLDFVWNHVGHPGPAAVEGIDLGAFELAIELNLRTVLITTE